MRVLLVDHDSEGLETVARAIRGVLELDCVTSKGDALLLLRQNTYDVLIACERCVDGSGLDLLGRTTRTAVPLKRIFAAAPERLQLLGPRLAPFKVQRTINYPIDLEELWLAIAQVTRPQRRDRRHHRARGARRTRHSRGRHDAARAHSAASARAAVRGTRPPPAIAIRRRRRTRAPPRALAQPAPEPPLARRRRRRASPRQSHASRRACAGPLRHRPHARASRRRAPAAEPTPPLARAGARNFRTWTPEPPPEDDFAEIAAQARLGVQQKVVDEASRRKRQRLIAAGGIAVVVAGTLVFLIEKFYDPDARAREKAIAAQIERMAEQQKVTDNLTLHRGRHRKRDHEQRSRHGAPRARAAGREGARASAPRIPAEVDRSRRRTRRARAASRRRATGPGAGRGAAHGGGPRSGQAARRTQRRAQRRTAPPRARRNAAPSARPRDAAPPSPSRSYGAPIGESPRQSQPPLDAPINSAPVTTVASHRQFLRRPHRRGQRLRRGPRRAAGTAPRPRLPAPRAIVTPPPNAAGSADVQNANVAPAPAPEPPAPVDVVPAKIVKRVTPVAPGNIPAKTTGYVVVQFNIGENGRVSDVEVVESAPQGVFDDAAQNAVRKWIYEPRKENGVAVASSAKARLVFDAG